MIKNFPFTRILGWSVSRWDTFTACKRQYFYQYYGKHDQENLLAISRLKELTSIPLEIGNVTHKILEILLHRLQISAVPIDEKRLVDFAVHRMKLILQGKVFSEIHYGQLNSIDEENSILPKVQLALQNFVHGERLPWLFEKALATKDQWIIDPEGYGECRIGAVPEANDPGLKAYCKVDFLFPIGDELHIIDWKTGKKDDAKHTRQLRGYVAWAYSQFNREFSKIKPTVAYLLPEYQERSMLVSEDDIEVFTDAIKEETEEMYKYCADVNENIPLPKAEFEMTENRNICRFCNFRELCGR